MSNAMSDAAVVDAPAEPGAGRATVNYRVAGPYYFGDNVRGTVIPRWVAELSGSLVEELVANGTLEETDEPVVKNFRAPEPKDEPDIAEAVNEELNRLRRDNVKLLAEAKALAGENETFRRNHANQVKSLGEQTADAGHWRSVAEKHLARVRELEAELALERETRPPGAKAPEAKAPEKKPAK